MILFGQEVPLFRIKLGYSVLILGPFTLKPTPFPPVGNFDASSPGSLSLDIPDLTCESKGGSVGDEELQCWEASNEVNPKIKRFKNVQKLGGGTSNRRLTDGTGEIEESTARRRLETTPYQFNCLLSEVDMSGSTEILIDYERCQISSNTFTISLNQTVGVGVTTFDTNLVAATAIMPSPIQDVLMTVVKECNAQWTIKGHTNMLIYGSEVQSGCKIIADGTDIANTTLTIDFGQGSCSGGHLISLNEGSIFIGDQEVVQFGSPFKDIIFVMSDCNDEVSILKTYSDALSIEVLGNGGNDIINIGDLNQPFDTNVFGNIILDGGAGSDALNIQDQTLSVSKPVEVRSTIIFGLHSTQQSVAYFDIENIDINLGTVSAQVDVLSLSHGTSVNLTTQDSDDSIMVANGKLAKNKP